MMKVEKRETDSEEHDSTSASGTTSTSLNSARITLADLLRLDRENSSSQKPMSDMNTPATVGDHLGAATPGTPASLMAARRNLQKLFDSEDSNTISPSLQKTPNRLKQEDDTLTPTGRNAPNNQEHRKNVWECVGMWTKELDQLNPIPKVNVSGKRVRETLSELTQDLLEVKRENVSCEHSDKHYERDSEHSDEHNDSQDIEEDQETVKGNEFPSDIEAMRASYYGKCIVVAL